MTDQELAQKVKDFMSENKYASCKEIRVSLKTSHDRLKRISDAGLVALPPRRSLKIAATQSRKKTGAYKNWYINRPADWMKN